MVSTERATCSLCGRPALLGFPDRFECSACGAVHKRRPLPDSARRALDAARLRIRQAANERTAHRAPR